MENLLVLECLHGIGSLQKNIGQKGRKTYLNFNMIFQSNIYNLQGKIWSNSDTLGMDSWCCCCDSYVGILQVNSFHTTFIIQKVICRKDYAVKCKDECKKLHKSRRKLFFLQLFLILLFFPIVPAVIYAQILWVWGIRNISIHSLEKRENLAKQIRGRKYKETMQSKSHVFVKVYLEVLKLVCN